MVEIRIDNEETRDTREDSGRQKDSKTATIAQITFDRINGANSGGVFQQARIKSHAGFLGFPWLR